MDNYQGPKVGWRPFTRNGLFPNGSVWALLLIAGGTLLFLDNLGLWPFAHLSAFWPLAISAFGLAQLSSSRCSSGTIWGVTMLAVGIFLTLGNLGILHVNIGSLWPLFLIAAGANMLLKRSWRPFLPMPLGMPVGASINVRSAAQGNRIHEAVIFSSVNRRIETANFEGGELNCIFGELKIDLRGAVISAPGREAVIEANVVFGAIKLRIPEHWKVLVRGSAVFGAYEDKTVPPRPAPGIDIPTLIVQGGCVFGAVEIEN